MTPFFAENRSATPPDAQEVTEAARTVERKLEALITAASGAVSSEGE